MSIRKFAVTTVAAMTTLLVGCAQPVKPLYHWEAYPRQVYEHLQGNGVSPQEQLRILEGQAEKARANNAALPPGFRAHLGLLYLQLERPDEARHSLEAEKAAFPESAQYMDFLLKGLTAPKS